MKALAKDPFFSIGSMKLPSGEFTSSLDGTLRHLMDHHFPQNVSRRSEQLREEVSSDYLLEVGDENAAKQIITKDKIQWAVNAFLPIKSPGEDGIFPAMIQNVSNISTASCPAAFRNTAILGSSFFLSA